MTESWSPFKRQRRQAWYLKVGLALASLPAIALAVALLASSTPNHAQAGAGNQPGVVPFYARTGTFERIVSEDWAVVYFYYEDAPECIPSDFNLMQFFDFAAPVNCNVPASRGTFVPNRNGGPPMHTTLTGNGDVPVWFARRSDFDAAINDGVLLIDELSSISLKGSASQFHESLNPNGGAQKVHIVAGGRGNLEDGRDFNFSYTATVFGRTGGAYQVNVHIK